MLFYDGFCLAKFQKTTVFLYFFAFDKSSGFFPFFTKKIDFYSNSVKQNKGYAPI